MLKVAQVGRFVIEKVSASPFASEAVGRKLYAEPMFTDRAGLPLMTGAAFEVDPADTVIVKAFNVAVALPSLTLIVTLLCVRAVVGVPDNVPVEVEKFAQLGLFTMLKPSVSPSASLATGRKLYAVPTFAVVGGVPEIVGARFVVLVLALTLIEKLGVLADFPPSEAVITMLEKVPTCELEGVPLSRPVVELKLAQVGLFAIVKTSGSPFESFAVGWKL